MPCDAVVASGNCAMVAVPTRLENEGCVHVGELELKPVTYWLGPQTPTPPPPPAAKKVLLSVTLVMAVGPVDTVAIGITPAVNPLVFEAGAQFADGSRKT
jgi:hypothetical protein